MNPVILFEDSSVIVTVKPAGIESQVSKSGHDMISALSEHTGGDIFPVHRLDRGTVGVMVYAKTKDSAASLSDAFANGKAEKLYLAVTLDTPSEAAGTYTDLLFHDVRKNKSFVTDKKRTGVRSASLSYRVIETLPEENFPTLVLVKLYTGRTHQIRVQFASRKTPLYGDGRYGGKISGVSDPALACVKLSFPHPTTGEVMDFTFTPDGGVWARFKIPQNYEI